VADIVGVVLIARAWRRPHTVLLPIEIHPLVGLTGASQHVDQAILRCPAEAGVLAAPQCERRNRERIQSFRRGGRRGQRIERAPTRERLPGGLRCNGGDHFRGGDIRYVPMPGDIPDRVGIDVDGAHVQGSLRPGHAFGLQHRAPSERLHSVAANAGGQRCGGGGGVHRRRHTGTREYEAHDSFGMIHRDAPGGSRSHRMAHQRCPGDSLGIHECQQIGGEVSRRDAEIGVGPATPGVGKIGGARASLIEGVQMQTGIQAKQLARRPRPLDCAGRVRVQ
jgi:hypothetical protein